MGSKTWLKLSVWFFAGTVLVGCNSPRQNQSNGLVSGPGTANSTAKGTPPAQFPVTPVQNTTFPTPSQPNASVAVNPATPFNTSSNNVPLVTPTANSQSRGGPSYVTQPQPPTVPTSVPSLPAAPNYPPLPSSSNAIAPSPAPGTSNFGVSPTTAPPLPGYPTPGGPVIRPANGPAFPQ